MRAFWVSGSEYCDDVVLVLGDEEFKQLHRLSRCAARLFKLSDPPDNVAWWVALPVYEPNHGELWDRVLDAGEGKSVLCEKVPDDWKLVRTETEQVSFSRFRPEQADLTWYRKHQETHEYLCVVDFTGAELLDFTAEEAE